MEHQDAVGEIHTALRDLLYPRAKPIMGVAVGLPDGDGPVPDVSVTTASSRRHPLEVPAELVHTVVEVSLAKTVFRDRGQKRAMYAAAGIPGYWRLERRQWCGYRGPVPALVVGLLREGRWDETVYPAGAEADIPVVFDRGPEDATVVKLDPAILMEWDGYGQAVAADTG
jgi:hypothetical protein